MAMLLSFPETKRMAPMHKRDPINAAMIKAQCVNTGTVRGSVGQISFRFTYIPESEFAGEEPQPAAGDAAPEQPAKAPAKKQSARKPAAGKRNAPKKK